MILNLGIYFLRKQVISQCHLSDKDPLWCSSKFERLSLMKAILAHYSTQKDPIGFIISGQHVWRTHDHIPQNLDAKKFSTWHVYVTRP